MTEIVTQPEYSFPIKIAVAGGSGAVGAEVCRLAVAYGARVTSLSRGGAPPTDEPWTVAVDWVACDALSPGFADTVPGDVDALLFCCPCPPQALDSLAVPRIVVVGCLDDATLSSGWGPAPGRVLALCGPVRTDGDPLETPPEEIRVEQLAMALLRACVEDDVAEMLDHDALRWLGDAVMWQ